MLTCFVITGYGIKKDYINNRDINLDKTFNHIVKPVFEDLGYECKRSCDYPPGIIDSIMYKGIYNADFVLADISTLNPNALYELGVRHALKPFTTLVICEDGILANGKLPFDLNHLTALPYHHDGMSLDIDEVERFKKILKQQVQGMIAAQQVDSPVYEHLQGLEVLLKNAAAVKEAVNVKIAADDYLKTAFINAPEIVLPAAAAPVQATGADAPKPPDMPQPAAGLPTLSDMIDNAITAMNAKQYGTAIDMFNQLLKIKPSDSYFIQQLCLATYKYGKPDAVTACNNAYKVLQQLDPMTSIDTETLGMAGAIHKNLYQLTGDKALLEKSMRFYERGYYIANDYYNGINAAFLYWQLASIATNKNETFFYAMQAQQIDKHVAEICNSLINSADYAKRKDRQWIINTLAEAYFGLDDTVHLTGILEERKLLQNNFSEDSFMQQFNSLKALKEKVKLLLQQPV